MPLLWRCACAASNWLGMSYGRSSGIARGPHPGAEAFAPNGMRLIVSTPQPIVASAAPAAMRLLAMWLACCDEPHRQSIVVAATS